MAARVRLVRISTQSYDIEWMQIPERGIVDVDREMADALIAEDPLGWAEVSTEKET